MAMMDERVESPCTNNVAKSGSSAYRPSSFSKATYSLHHKLGVRYSPDGIPLRKLDDILDPVNDLDSSVGVDLSDTGDEQSLVNDTAGSLFSVHPAVLVEKFGSVDRIMQIPRTDIAASQANLAPRIWRVFAGVLVVRDSGTTAAKDSPPCLARRRA